MRLTASWTREPILQHESFRLKVLVPVHWRLLENERVGSSSGTALTAVCLCCLKLNMLVVPVDLVRYPRSVS